MQIKRTGRTLLTAAALAGAAFIATAPQANAQDYPAQPQDYPAQAQGYPVQPQDYPPQAQGYPVQAPVDLSASYAPPALPVYDQPICPGDGYIWTPGYWAWGPGGYY